jgi:hypothetical protein
MENNSADIWGKVFKKNKDIVSRKIAGELFVVPVKGRLADMQRIFALNQVAEYIWQALDGRTTLDDLRKHILSHYDVEKERAESDIIGFIDDLIAADLIME